MHSTQAGSTVRSTGAPRWRSLCAALAIAALSPLPAQAQTWAPNESLASAQPDLIDYEFSQSRGMLAWNSEDGKLWLAWVDMATGLFTPSDGKGILADADTMNFEDAQKTKNGPEFASSSIGDVVVYTKYAGRHTDANSRIGYAAPDANGTWVGGLLGPEGAVRKAPYGSSTDGDPAPRITYVDAAENHYWREIWNPATEQLIPDFPASNYPIRHVRGARAVTYPLPVNGIDQIFYRDLDTGVVEQMTFDPGVKYEVWMWRAPEYNNEFVFMTLVDQVEFRVYRKLPTGPGGSMVWTPIYSQKAVSGNQMFSPEPFVWKGKSYVFMAQTVKPNKFRSEIWIANIDAAAPIFKRITPTALLRTRTDPEVFITSKGPLIYYNRLVPEEGRRGPKSCRNPACSEGVWFANPGLPG